MESPLSPHNSSAPASLSQGVAKALQGLHLEDQEGLLIEEVLFSICTLFGLLVEHVLYNFHLLFWGAFTLIPFPYQILFQVEGPGSPGSPQTFGRESAPTSPPQSPHSFLITPGSFVAAIRSWFNADHWFGMWTSITSMFQCWWFQNLSTTSQSGRTIWTSVAKTRGRDSFSTTTGTSTSSSLASKKNFSANQFWNNLTPRCQCNQWIFLSGVQW